MIDDITHEQFIKIYEEIKEKAINASEVLSRYNAPDAETYDDYDNHDMSQFEENEIIFNIVRNDDSDIWWLQLRYPSDDYGDDIELDYYFSIPMFVLFDKKEFKKYMKEQIKLGYQKQTEYQKEQEREKIEQQKDLIKTEKATLVELMKKYPEMIKK